MTTDKINYNKLFRQRSRDLAAIRDHKQPKCTPIIIPTKEWAIDYYGKYTHAQLHYDYSKIEDVIDHLYSNVPMDAITPGYPGARSGPLDDATGAMTYEIPGRELEVNSAAQFPQKKIYMESNEYEEFIADPFTFFLEKSIPRKHFHLRDSPLKEISLIKGALEYSKYSYTILPIFMKIAQNYGIPPLFQTAIPTGPMDFIGDFLRTLPQLFLDIKCRPEEVKAAADAIIPFLIKYGEFAFPKPATYPWILIPLHVGMFLSPKDFEELYWPSFKKFAITLINDGYTPAFVGERNWDPYIEFLAELPKGSFWLFENIDFNRINEELPNISFGGTISMELLKFGNPEQNVADIKKQIEEFAPRGGFALITPVPLLGLGDAKPENVVAIANYLFKMRTK